MTQSRLFSSAAAADNPNSKIKPKQIRRCNSRGMVDGVGPRGQMLANRALHVTAMHDIVSGYLQRLPGAMVTVGQNENDEPIKECIYTPHSIRATTATLLLDAGVDIAKVQELLGHKHITTTQIYDKRRRTTKESASHDVPV